jgi:hypothetical protein
MSSLLLPQGRIPIGFATVGGQRVPVEVDQQWMRYFTTLTERAGGIVAPTNIVNYISSTVAPSVVLDSGGDDSGDQVMIPGPAGPQGPKGDPGPALFLMEDPIDNDIYWRV